MKSEMERTDYNERFERLAAIFFAKYGVLAPGKDEPAAAPTPTDEHRWQLWNDWNPTEDLLTILMDEEAENDELRERLREMSGR